MLTRYVLFELCKVFLLALTTLTVTMLIVGVVKEAVDQGLGMAQIARLIPFILPDALRFSVPATILLTVSFVYSRMSSSNEVVALKSLGISAMTILWPALIAAFLLSLATVWLNDLAVSWGRTGVQRVALEAIEEIAYGMLRTRRSYSSQQFSINVKQVQGRTLIKPTMSFQPSPDRPPITVRAEEAELHSDPKANELRVICRDFTVFGSDDVHVSDPDEFTIPIPLDKAGSAQGHDDRHPSRLPMWELPAETARQLANVTQLEQELAVRASLELLVGDLTSLNAYHWGPPSGLLKSYREHHARLRTEPYRRWSAGFSCLCFVMVGAPMAIRLRNSHFLSSFAFCFFPILLVYYPLLAYGIGAAKDGRMPPIVVWLSNAILCVWGLWLLRRVIRY